MIIANGQSQRDTRTNEGVFLLWNGANACLLPSILSAHMALVARKTCLSNDAIRRSRRFLFLVRNERGSVSDGRGLGAEDAWFWNVLHNISDTGLVLYERNPVQSQNFTLHYALILHYFYSVILENLINQTIY